MRQARCGAGSSGAAVRIASTPIEKLPSTVCEPSTRPRIAGVITRTFCVGFNAPKSADRQRSTLMVQAAYLEPNHDARHVAPELIEELRLMQHWLSLDHIEIANRGNLAPALRPNMPTTSSSRIGTTTAGTTNVLRRREKRVVRPKM